MTLMFVYLYICHWGYLRKEKKSVQELVSHIKTRNCYQPGGIVWSVTAFGLS